MNEQELKNRTKRFALQIILFAQSLPNASPVIIIGKQLLRSGTSVGANYRAACRGKSKADFIAKLGSVVEEADECCYWLELLIESGSLPKEIVEPLLLEANELTAIFVSSIKTAQKRKNE